MTAARPSPGPGTRAAAAALLVLALAAGTALLARRWFSSPGPDIVLIVWDTCRGDRVEVNGYRLPTTPRLAKFAAEGVNFRYCFTPSPWTPPAHASLFTGLLPSRHGLREKVGDRVHPGIPLLASTLAEAGYETVAAPANPLLGVTGLLDGFETVLPPTPGADKDAGETVAARIEEWARARAGRAGPRRPLFLFVNLMDSHLPLSPAREDVVAVHGETAAASVPSEGAGISTYAALDHLLGLKYLDPELVRILPLVYDAGVHADDRATGRILDLLRKEGIYDGAFVAITGDHGECLGERGELEHRMSIREPALRVPLVVRWPGGKGGGRTEDAQVRLQDLYRTILDAAGASPPAAAGRDSVALAGPAVEPRDAVAELQAITTILPEIHRRFPRIPPLAVERFRSSYLVFREGARGPSPRKFVLATVEEQPGLAAGEREELFDLKSDPGEERDLLLPGGDPGPAAEAPGLRRKALESVR